MSRHRGRPRQLFYDHRPNLGLRLRALTGALLLFAGLICFRLYDLQRDEHSKWLKIAAKQHQGSVQVQGVRGSIFDSAGRTLATSVRAVSLGAHPGEITDIPGAAKKLAAVLHLPASVIEEKLNSAKPFVWLARGLQPNIAEDLDALQLPGLRHIPEFRRYYPQGELAGVVLGRINRDGEGLAGVELALNKQLSAPNVSLPVRRDARGRLLAAGKPGSDNVDILSDLLADLPQRTSALLPALLGEPPVEESEIQIRKEGSEVVLSIDSVSQGILEEEFAQGAKDTKAQRVFGLVMDALSGEILALSQTPTFDPNQFEHVSPQDLHNSVIHDSFEPGSTMKPLVAAVAMELGAVTDNEILNCEGGEYRVGSHTIRDVHPQHLLALRDVLIRSSNICMAKLGQRLGPKRLYESLLGYGFGKPTDVELPGEATGILRSVKHWAEIDVATHAFGQGISVTAIQLTQAYAVLASGGFLVRPRLMKQSPLEPTERTRVLSSQTVKKINSMLQGVTEDEHGTGQKAKISGITVYGKTGTAQKARTDGKGYDTGKVLASFVGFTDGRQVGLDRSLVMLVAVDEPGVNPRWGGTVAAPIFQRAMARILSHLLAVELKNARSASNNSAPHRFS